MTRRLLGNPSVIALAALVLVGVIAANWAIGVSAGDQPWMRSGAATEAQFWDVRILQIASQLPAPATLVVVVAVLGILVIGSAEWQRASRTVSVAGFRPTDEPRTEEQA